jgi:2-amino-4-hydroxy-6-hydroxymethyldihydropteridine diphosphokinase
MAVPESIAFIAVGANIEPERHIEAALALLHEETRVVASSTFYRTDPIGGPDQPPFINGVWLLETNVAPAAIRNEWLRPIESGLGRRRTEDKFAPRTIDLDLVLYDDWTIDDGDVRLPHPDLQRPFVYIPVMELLAGVSATAHGDLPDRIRSLLPRRTTADEPGQKLEHFTEQLRDLLRR